MPDFFTKHLPLILFCIFCTSLHSQQKYERESRLKTEDVPQSALAFIKAAEIPGKIKWYIEYGLESKSIEAKFKWKKKRHSVEFDIDGVIEDIEIEIKPRELHPNILNEINATLKSLCLKYKISKIQRQYTGTQSVLLSLLKDHESKENFTTKYEIIATCVSEGKTEQFEYLFSEEGKLLQQFKIIFKNSSNLEY